jgi:hypothetical protein
MPGLAISVLAAVAFGQPVSKAVSPAADNVCFSITITELPGALIPREKDIRAHILAAAKTWTDLVDSKRCTIDIVFGVRDVVADDPRKLGYGKSVVSARFENEHGSGQTFRFRRRSRPRCTSFRAANFIEPRRAVRHP